MATVKQIIGGMLLRGTGGGGEEGGPPPHKKRAPAARVAVDDGWEEDVETDDKVSGDDTVGCKYCGIRNKSRSLSLSLHIVCHICTSVPTNVVQLIICHLQKHYVYS